MSSPCPRPEDLDSASGTVREHLAKCPDCAALKRIQERLRTAEPAKGSGRCLSPEAMAALAVGPPDPPTSEHLSACGDCREEWLEIRGLLGEKARTEQASARLKQRLVGLKPSRRPWILVPVAAAAILLALGAMFAGSPGPTQPPPPTAKSKSPPPPPVRVVPPKEVAPEPTPPTPVPATPAPAAPQAPVPAPIPPAEKAPLVDPPPSPKPEPPAVVAEKSPERKTEVPAVTRALRKASVVLVAGSLSMQAEGEKAWSSARVDRSREFMGVLGLKADVASAKLRIGPDTIYLRRGAELSLVCEEEKTGVRLDRGEALFDIVPGRHPWSVETERGKVSVLGTRFLVASDNAATEVLLQRGSVEVSTKIAKVILKPGEMSVVGNEGAPEAAKPADLARRLTWVQALEETLRIEAEQMAFKPGFSVAADPAASGGRCLVAKDRLVAGQEASAEVRVRTKQSGPYHVWVRLQWGHNVPSGAWVQAGDAATWSGKDLRLVQEWRWTRMGAVDPGEGALPVKLGDGIGGIRFDQVVLTTDPEFNTESR